MDYKKELKKIEDNKDEFLRRYGKKQYQKAVNYYTRKINYSPFEQADISPSMKEYDSLISNTQKKNEFLKKYGPDQYEIALDYYSDLADKEIDEAYTTYQSVLQQPKLSTLQKYGVDAKYSDSYEDKIRKLAGASPASFDISQYAPTEGMPDTWDDQSVDLALSAWKTKRDQEAYEMARQSSARQNYAARQSYEDMVGALDFEKYASEGAQMDSTLLEKAKSINFNDFKYKTLNDKEVATYNYILGKYGQNDAGEYLNSISDQLSQRLGEATAESVKDNPVLPYVVGAGAGAEQFEQGIAQNFSSDALPTTTLQYAGAETRENLGDVGKTIYDVAQSAGYMAPLIGVSVATGGLGAPAALAEGAAALTMFGSAKGNAYKSALDQGYSKDQANTYSLLSGAAEAGLQYLLGGISKIGGKATGGIASKLTSNIDNALLKTATNLGVRMAGEGTEEYLQSILDPVLRNITLGETNEFDPLDPDALNSFVVGALTAGFLEGPVSISSQISNNKAGNAVAESRKTYELIDNALMLDENTKAYKMAANIGTVTESKIGELLKQYISDGGDTSFMKTPSRIERNLQQVVDQQFDVDENGEIDIPELPDINNLPELPPVEQTGGIELLQRIEQPGVGRASIDKPQGIYTSPGNIESPHSDLGGQTYWWVKNPNAKVLEVKGYKMESPRINIPVEMGSGVYALAEIWGKDTVQNYLMMPIKELRGMAEQLFPEYDWTRQKDTQDIIESMGGIMTREFGYDAISMKDSQDPEFDEYIILTENAARPIDKPIEQTQAQSPATPEIGAQGATANAQTKVHESAESLLETYAGTEYGDLLASEIERGGASYTQESAVTDLNKAIQDVQSGKLTVDNYISVIQENGELSKYNKTDVTRLMALIDDAVQRGDTAAYEELNAAIFDVGLQLGRGVQAFALLKKSSPAMHLASIEREISRFNIDGQKKFKDKWNDVSLTQEEKQAILNGQTVDERTAAYQSAIQRIQGELPSTTWDKLDQLRKTSMLFNPRTQIRNIVGNAMYMAINAINRKIEAGLQQFTPKDQRTESFIIKPEYRKKAKGDFENVKDTYKNYGRFNMDAKLGQGYTQAFKNKGIGKAINKVSEITGMALDIGDVVFGKHHYETALASYMQAKGLKEITGEARAYAMERALEATFRAESKAANAINQLIKKGGITGKAASVVMPFVKTPINIARAGFDFSPLGMGKSLIVDTIRVKKGDMSATQYIHNLSKGLTGTGVATLGLVLALGMLIPGVELTGAPPEDKKEREFLYAQGFKPYSLKIGDTYFPISWAQPVATTMLMGVTVADTIGRDEDFQLVDATGLIGTFFDSIAEISPLAGLKDLFQYNEGIGEAVVNTAQDLASQFIPAVGRQISRVVDPNEYDIYTGDPLNQLKNQAASTLGLADEADVAQKVDVWGQPKTQEGDWFGRLLQNMVSPTNISTAPEDAVNDELMRLYKATGDADALPIVFDARELTTNDVKEIFGDTVKLTAKELQTLKEGIGQSSRIVVEDYINSEQYKSDDDETRVKTINVMYYDIRTLYRQAKARGIDLPSVTDQVDVQSQKYFSGEADNPIPDAAMLLPEYDYGVNNDVSDILFALYKDTGDNAFLLEPENTFKYKGKTYEYGDDPRVEVFEGYGELPGLNDIVGSAWFDAQSDEQKAKIIDSSVDDILEALKIDVVSQEDPLAVLSEPEKVDTTAYERFNTPGWKGYGTDDKIIKQLDSLGVYPKNVDSFSAKNDLAQGTYTLTETDKKTLADMTYKELLKLGTFDAESAQKAIDKAYADFKDMIIEREK